MVRNQHSRNERMRRASMFDSLLCIAVIIAAVVLVIINIRDGKVSAKQASTAIVLSPDVVEIPDAVEYVPYTESQVELLAKTAYGEMLPTSDTEQAAVMWNILNMVDSDEFPDTVEEVVNSNRYNGYDESNPVTDHLRWLAEDVLTRWYSEKRGETNVGRVLPPEYMYFEGDGTHNYFRNAYEAPYDIWDWSLESPYKN